MHSSSLIKQLWTFSGIFLHIVSDKAEKEGLQWKERSSCSSSCVEGSIWGSRKRFGETAAVFLAAGAIEDAGGLFPLPLYSDAFGFFLRCICSFCSDHMWAGTDNKLKIKHLLIVKYHISECFSIHTLC